MMSRMLRVLITDNLKSIKYHSMFKTVFVCYYSNVLNIYILLKDIYIYHHHHNNSNVRNTFLYLK
jgi:hypothetical protein